MVFQWYLFVLLIAVGIFAYQSGQVYTVEICGRQERRFGWLPVLMIAVPLIYLAGTRTNIGDTAAYRSGFLNSSTSWSAIPGILASEGKDKGFTIFTLLLKSVIGNHDKLYFTIIAAFCLMVVVTVYRKHSCNFLMTMFLFIASGDYVQWNYNGMRQFIAVAIVFSATNLLLQKKYFPYICVALLASTIHATALIMIPICFIVQGRPWNTRTLLFLAAVLFAITSVDQLTNLITNLMENTQYSGEVGQFLETEGTNMLRVLVFCIPPALSLLFKKRIDRANIPIINLSVNMSIASMGAYIVSGFTSGIFVGRVPIFFSLYNYILLPWIIENVFEKRSARLVYVVMIAFYLIFYYYQMEITWGL